MQPHSRPLYVWRQLQSGAPVRCHSRKPTFLWDHMSTILGMWESPNCLSIHEVQCGGGNGDLGRVMPSQRHHSTLLSFWKGLFSLWRRRKPWRRQALISCVSVWHAYSRTIWHHSPGLTQSWHGSGWLHGAMSLGKAGTSQPKLRIFFLFLPMKCCVSREICQHCLDFTAVFVQGTAVPHCESTLPQPFPR